MTIKECVKCPGATDHSTAECPTLRVPRELLERVAKPVETQYDRDQRWKALEELRALLTAQPQASAVCPACEGRPSGNNVPCAVCSKQASAAQSAPAGAREAFEAKFPVPDSVHFDEVVGYQFDGDRDPVQGDWEAFQAGAAWQRTQSAGVPEGWCMERSGDRIIVRQLPTGAGYAAAREGESGISESVLYLLADTMLATAPAQPAARQEPVVHACAGCVACEGSPESDNNPCHVCGGTVSAAQDQGEVQRLREAVGSVVSAGNGLSNIAYNLAQLEGAPLSHYTCELMRMQREQWGKAVSALAASTGQEV